MSKKYITCAIRKATWDYAVALIIYNLVDFKGFTGAAAQPQHEKSRATKLYETTWTLQWMPTE